MISTSIFLVCLTIGQAPITLGQSQIIDLDAPGTLDALARDHPSHYEKVAEILAEVLKQPDSEVPQWMRTNFNAHDVVYGPLLLASLPPKRHLSFKIDDVRYKSIVTVTNRTPKPTPTK